MADTVVGLQIKADSQDAIKSVGSIKAELRAAQEDAVGLARSFGELSPQAQAAAKKVALLRDEIADTNERVALFDPGAKFKVFGNVLQTAAGGFSALTGAAAVFGAESEDLQKTLVKVQGALALSQGLSVIVDAGKDFSRLKVIALDALKGIKAGVAATGIGLFAVALGLIVTYWEDIKGLVSGVSSEQKKLNDLTDENLKTEQEKLDTIGSQDNVLKLQGKSEKEILGLKKKQIEAVILATKESIRQAAITSKQQEAAAKRNFDLLKGLLDFITLPIRTVTKLGIDAINGLIGLVNKIPGINIEARINGEAVDQSTGFIASLLFDPAKTKAAGEADAKEREGQLSKLNNDLAGVILSQQSADKKDVVSHKEAIKEKEKATFEYRSKEADEFKKFQEDIIKLQAEADAEAAKNQQAQNELFNILQLERLSGPDLEREKLFRDYQERLASAEGNAMLIFEVQKNYADKKKALDEQVKADEIAREKAVNQEKLQIISGALGSLADLLGRHTVAGKSLAIAQATIDGFLAVQKALASAPPPFNFIAAATVGVATLANIRNIIKTKVPGQAGGGGGSVPSGLAANIPSIPRPNQTTTQLDQGSINQIGNATSRSFVLESDVSSSQERIKRLNRAARLN